MHSMKHHKISGLNTIKKDFKTPFMQEISLIIGVSVGSKKHDGEALAALVEAINRLHKSVKITNCTIAVCDSLQRHNYRIDGKTDEEKALSMSKKAGAEWIEANIETLKHLNVDYTIVRWDTWLKDEKRYREAFLEISNLLAQDYAFQKTMDNSIQVFSSRFNKRYQELGISAPINDDVLQKSCRDYLLEECAIIMKMWPLYKQEHSQYILYPEKMTEALEYVYKQVVPQKKRVFTKLCH